MTAPLLVEFFDALPEDALQGVEDLPADRQAMNPATNSAPKATGGKAKRRAALHLFNQKVREKYTEGTLMRLAQADNLQIRKSAVFALGQVGTLAANQVLARILHDDDSDVADVASAALWRVWFRGDDTTASDELYRIVRLRDAEQAILALDALLAKADSFAEAYNQRAILMYRTGKFDRAAKDCARVIKLNPHHFGAQAGMGQCLLRLRRQPAALKAFRQALRINPRLDGVAATVRALENALGGEEGR
ncbi:MAG: tetratricopeptide repeat protein [Planctomycetia bacterium]|nr:tetratricopeptide repeat protein [Planctomycetia bacterium]